MAQKFISTAILIAIMCRFSEQNKLMDETYNECSSETLTCVGMPTDCVAERTCSVLLSVKPTQTGAQFMLHWTRDPTSMNKWVAAGLSMDKKMGDDSVTECILKNHTMVIVRQGLTYCNETGCGVDTIGSVKGITGEMGTYSDEDVLSCSWSRIFDTTVGHFDFNIKKNKYYILLAYGPLTKGELETHTDKWVSKEAYLLGRNGATTSATTAGSTTAGSSTAKPTSAQPQSTTKVTTSIPTSTSGNTTMTGTPSNTTSTAGNTTSTAGNTTSYNTTPRKPKTTTKPKNGSKTITYGLSLGIFATIVLSLNL